MSDRSDLMDVAQRLQECKRLVMSERFVNLSVLLNKATDLVAVFQDQDKEICPAGPVKTLDPRGPVDDF